jgi:hypothetical protein
MGPAVCVFVLKCHIEKQVFYYETGHQQFEGLEQAKMAKQKRRDTNVIVEQVSSVELTRRGSSNSLIVKVRSGKDLLGNLVMGRGSVQWWPAGNSAIALEKSWPDFVRLLESAMAKK